MKGATVIPQDLTGKKFGRLNVIKFSRNDPKIGNFWLCACECGNHCERQTRHLKDKHNKCVSCGCAKKESIAIAAAAAWKVTTKFTHLHKHKLKWVYGNMIRRCYKPGSRRYERYGGRGITVCEEWKNNPTSFFNWCVESGYEYGLTIDRKNNDGNYEPSNCKWSTPQEQQQNTSRSRFITWNGERLNISQWSKRLGVSYGALAHRINRWKDLNRVFAQPFRK